VKKSAAPFRPRSAEDVGKRGDVTTLATVPETATASAVMRAREPLVPAGLAFAETAFHELSSAIKITPPRRRWPAGQGRSIPLAHRRLRARDFERRARRAEFCPAPFPVVATLTAQFVTAIHGTRASILDTRKTTPGWRSF